MYVVFLGTEKYPDETEYSKFLSQHGGSSNAYTAGDHTNYYFDVTPKNLEGALDRFSQFFIAPLFTESATDREVNAVNSEHEKNLPSDSWRLRQLESSLSDPEHDYHKFGTGSKVGYVRIASTVGQVQTMTYINLVSNLSVHIYRQPLMRFQSQRGLMCESGYSSFMTGNIT